MPTYEHECGACGAVIEVVCPVSERNCVVTCPCQLARAAGKRLAAKRVILTAPMGQPDIAPYLGTAGDRKGLPITSRREHREYLKRNNLRELGTDVPKNTAKMRTSKLSGNDRQQLRATIRDELRRKVPRHILEKRG